MRVPRRLHGHALVCLVLGLAGTAACRAGPTSDVSDSAYVATMADLRRVQRDSVGDSASLARARQAVLQGRGLTAERMERHARALAAEPERASKVFQAIALKAAPALPRENVFRPTPDAPVPRAILDEQRRRQPQAVPSVRRVTPDTATP